MPSQWTPFTYILRRGWDQTGSNGANLSFPQEFGIGAGSQPPGTPNHERDNWLVGLVNAAPYIGSAFMYDAAFPPFQRHYRTNLNKLAFSCTAINQIAVDVGYQILSITTWVAAELSSPPPFCVC